MSTFESMSLLGGVAPLSTASSTATQETNSQFKWNGRTVGLAVGTGVLVITCVALGVLVNPAFFGAIPFILGGAWALMGSPTLNDLLGGSGTTTQEQLPLLSSGNRRNYGSVEANLTGKLAKTDGLPKQDDDTDYTRRNDLGRSSTPLLNLTSSFASTSSPITQQQPNRTDAQARAKELLESMQESGLNQGVDVVYFRTQLYSQLHQFKEFAEEFLECTILLYNADKKLELIQKSASDKLENIAHNISLCDRIIESVPKTESGQAIISNFTSKRRELEEQRNHILLELRTHAEESAKHLGQKAFPGQLPGYRERYTLLGEVEALLQSTPLEQINGNVAKANEKIAAAEQAYNQNDSTIRDLDRELSQLQAQLSEKINSGKLPQTTMNNDRKIAIPIRDRREEYSKNISDVEVKIAENAIAILNAHTRTALLPLVDQRYELELALLQYQYQYEILCAHYTLEQGPVQADISNLLKSHIGKLEEINKKVTDLGNNAKALESEIEHFQKADETKNTTHKEIARKNIARLMANHYSYAVIRHETSDLFGGTSAQSFYSVLRKGWLASKTGLGEHLSTIDDLPSLQQDLSDLAKEMDTKLTTFREISEFVPTAQSSIEKINSELHRAYSASSTLRSQIEQTRADKIAAENTRETLKMRLNKLHSNIERVCSQPDFRAFIDAYRNYAHANKIPENEQAQEIITILSRQFPLLNQFPQLQIPILVALGRNGIDTSRIELTSLNFDYLATSSPRLGSHPIPSSSSSNSAFGAMVGSSRKPGNFEDDEYAMRSLLARQQAQTSSSSSDSDTTVKHPIEQPSILLGNTTT